MRRGRACLALVALSVALAACGDAGASSDPTTSTPATSTTGATPSGHDHGDGGATMDPADEVAAMAAARAFQDVATAEQAGYASSLDALGCFQDSTGGMGVHYIDQALMDDHVDIAEPEALVYELAADGHVAALVAHEYIVPIDAWTASEPPELFGVAFHRHPTLPLWVLHTWLWKPNPAGMFADWNPAVPPCPAGVPIFGVDRPTPTTSPPTSANGQDARSVRFGPH